MQRPIHTWYEPFGGTFAVGLRLEDPKGRPPCTYQGGKMMVAEATLHAAGYEPGQRAERYLYTEKHWTVWRGMDSLRLVDPEALRQEILALQPGVEGYADIMDDPELEPGSPRWCAQFWALQSCSVQGKPPSWDRDAGWKPSGYGGVSPAGRARGFKERLNPPPLAKKIKVTRALLERMDLSFYHADALDPAVGAHLGPGDVVYIDPAYTGRTAYRGIRRTTRAEVIQLAQRYRGQGCRVLLAEAEPIEIPGARHVKLKRADGCPLPRSRDEWLTILEGA